MNFFETLGMNLSILADIPDAFAPVWEKIQELFYDYILQILFGVMSIVFVALSIVYGMQISVADTPEAKKKATQRLGWMLFGLAISVILTFAMPTIINILIRLFPAPSSNFINSLPF